MMFVSLENSEINAIDVTVSRMISMSEVFHFEGIGSRGNLQDTFITENEEISSRWNGVAVTNEAKVKISNFVFVNNNQVANVFIAAERSHLKVTNSLISGVVGTNVSKRMFIPIFISV